MQQKMIGWAFWLSPLALSAQEVSPLIRVDQFGYLPDFNKIAVIVDPQTGFNAEQQYQPGPLLEVHRAGDHQVVFKGAPVTWQQGATHVQSGDRGWYFDFSSLKKAGTYYIFDPATRVRSYAFSIGPAVYDSVLAAALRVFFYQRINCDKPARFAYEKWADGPCFDDAGAQAYAVRNRWAMNDSSTTRDLHGGWYDAGDPNKYTTFAFDPMMIALETWRQHPKVFADNYNIPESGNGIPDLLDELKWELEWLCRMQNTDNGGFLLKDGVITYEDKTPMSADRRPRFYLPECTSATLSGAAILAAAAVVYQAQPQTELQVFGRNLQARAMQAFSRARSTTREFTYFETECDDQLIKSGDADVDSLRQIQMAMSAAVYLYEATGQRYYRDFVEKNIRRSGPLKQNTWEPYTQSFGVVLLRYSTLRGVPKSTRQLIRDHKLNHTMFGLADAVRQADLYRAFLSDNYHNWGSNMRRAGAGGMLLDMVSFGLDKKQGRAYREAAADYLHYLHGVNPLGLVYLTNMYSYGGDFCANEMYHTGYNDGTPYDHALLSPKGPPPGYLTGGPNRFYTGTEPGIKDQPPGKAYKDWNGGSPYNSWEITEPAIYYQMAYINLLARLIPR
jgi:endoglucanase